MNGQPVQELLVNGINKKPSLRRPISAQRVSVVAQDMENTKENTIFFNNIYSFQFFVVLELGNPFF